MNIDFLKTIKKISQIHFNNACKDLERYIDKDYEAYNKNHSNILLFYSSITQNSDIYNNSGYISKKEHYGKCGLNTAPVLYNESETILFFTINNRLDSNFIAKIIRDLNKGKKLYIVQFDISENHINRLVAREYINNRWEKVLCC